MEKINKAGASEKKKHFQMKEKLRKKLKSLRDKLSKDEIIKKSMMVKNNLFRINRFINSNLIMFYVTFRSEVDTLPMIEKSLSEGKRIALPIVKKNPKTMVAVEIKDINKDLCPGTFGILEPRDTSKKINPEKIDLVIVPGVGFDIKGRRIGYGGGYYDQWLCNFELQKRIGICFELQLLEKLPSKATAENDLPVGTIVTEKRIISISE